MKTGGETYAQAESRKAAEKQGHGSHVPDEVMDRFHEEFGDYPQRDQGHILSRIIADHEPPTWR